MLRSRLGQFLASARRTRFTLFRAMLVSAALGGAAAWLVAGAASASPPPPVTGPPTVGPPPTTGPTTVTQPGVTNPPPTTPSPSATPRCSRAQLRLKFVDMQGATGHRYIDYAFKNVGTTACSLSGYPRGQLLTKRGRVMHGAREKVGHDPLSPMRTLVIDPGKRAFFTFTWVDGGFCPGDSFTFYALRVFPPGDLRGFVRRFGQTPACSKSAMVTRVRPKRFPF